MGINKNDSCNGATLYCKSSILVKPKLREIPLQWGHSALQGLNAGKGQLWDFTQKNYPWSGSVCTERVKNLLKPIPENYKKNMLAVRTLCTERVKCLSKDNSGILEETSLAVEPLCIERIKCPTLGINKSLPMQCVLSARKELKALLKQNSRNYKNLIYPCSSASLLNGLNDC